MYDEIVTKVMISKPQYLAKDTQCLMLLLIWTFVHRLNLKFTNNKSELSVFIFWETILHVNEEFANAVSQQYCWYY